MRRALANSDYRRLYLAQIVALAGTGLATVALGLVAYTLDPANAGGILATIFTIKMVAYVGIAPLAQAAIARLSRRGVLIGADAVRVAIALVLPFVGEAWQIFVLVFVVQAASATFTPTFQSVIPDLLPDAEDYTAALSLSRLAYDLESVLAPAAAALLLLLIPANALFIGTAIGFAASALLVLGAAIPAVGGGAGHALDASFGVRARAGIRHCLRTPTLRAVLALNLVVAASGAFVLVQTVVIAKSVLGLGDTGVGLLLAVYGGGSMLAALGMPGLVRRMPERRIMLSAAVLLVCATALTGLALTAFAEAQPGAGDATRSVAVGAGAVVIGLLWIVAGFGSGAIATPIGRLIRRAAPPTELGPVFAAQFSLSHACWLLTYPLAGWLVVLGLPGGGFARSDGGGAAEAVLGLPGTAFALAAIALVGTVVAWRVWPAPRPGSSEDSSATIEP